MKNSTKQPVPTVTTQLEREVKILGSPTNLHPPFLRHHYRTSFLQVYKHFSSRRKMVPGSGRHWLRFSARNEHPQYWEEISHAWDQWPLYLWWTWNLDWLSRPKIPWSLSVRRKEGRTDIKQRANVGHHSLQWNHSIKDSLNTGHFSIMTLVLIPP